MASNPGDKYTGNGQRVSPPPPPTGNKIDMRFGPVDDYERRAAAVAGVDTSDWLALTIPTATPPQVQINQQDGALLLTITCVIPPGMLKIQERKVVVLPNGQPAMDLGSALVSVPHMRLVVKRSGLTDPLREHPIVQGIKVPDPWVDPVVKPPEE